MRRRVLHFLVAGGLLLTVAVGAVWARSLLASDAVARTRTWIHNDRAFMTDNVELISGAGRLRIVQRRTTLSLRHLGDAITPVRYDYTVGRARAYQRALAPTTVWGWLGFEFENARDPSGGLWRAVQIPTWFAFLFSAALTAAPARALLRARCRARRLARGQCPACGYDLRGAAHDRCPECGKLVDPSPAAAAV